MIVIDIVSFWRWLMVSNCVLESMLAPRNHFATDIPYLKAMARLRVLVSQKALRIICESIMVKEPLGRINSVPNTEESRKEGFLGGEPPRNPAPQYLSIGDYLTIVSSLNSSFEFVENAVVIVVVIFVVVEAIVIVVELTGH